MFYAACDSGNYFVIPGSPAEAWEVDNFMVLYKDNRSNKMDHGSDDFVITIVGSQILYRGLWLEHALILKALRPLFAGFRSDDTNSTSDLKIIVLSSDLTGNYSVAIEVRFWIMSGIFGLILLWLHAAEFLYLLFFAIGDCS